MRLLVAAALLFTVYLLASLLPVDTAGMDFSVIGGFLVFWVLGGVFTITLLALSDRRS